MPPIGAPHQVGKAPESLLSLGLGEHAIVSTQDPIQLATSPPPPTGLLTAEFLRWGDPDIAAVSDTSSTTARPTPALARFRSRGRLVDVADLEIHRDRTVAVPNPVDRTSPCRLPERLISPICIGGPMRPSLPILLPPPSPHHGTPGRAGEQLLPGALESVAELPINPGNLAVTARAGSSRRCTNSAVPRRNSSRSQARELQALAGQGMERALRLGPGRAQQRAGHPHRPQGTPLGDRQWPGGPTPDAQAGGLLAGRRQAGLPLRLPPETGPAGSFLNDLAVDDARGFVYLADVGGNHEPALVMVDLKQTPRGASPPRPPCRRRTWTWWSRAG